MSEGNGNSRGTLAPTQTAPGATERAAASLRAIGPALGGFVLPFALVLYLALRGGGYDAVVRGEIGVAVWWLVGLGALAGALPVVRLTRTAWIGLALLAAFCAWTALGLGWTGSTESTVAEIGRISGYVGIFALALAAQGRDGLRLTVSAVAAAIGVVGVLAVMSRLDPGLFPASAGVLESVEGLESRLAWPLDYWNGLAGFLAVGVVLLLVVAEGARSIVARAAAAAVIPALVLAIFLTLSRGGAIELAVGLAVLVAVHPRRLALALPMALGALGGGIAVAAASQRDAVVDGAIGRVPGADAEGMVAVLIVVCVGVGLLQAAVALADRYEAGPRLRPGRRTTAVGWGAAALLAVVVAIAAGLPSQVGQTWESFRSADVTSDTSTERLLSTSGSGRYQFWDAAMAANATDPIVGIGAGTYEYWWAQEGDLPLFVRDAHSLYIEQLAETGIVGFVLIVGFVGLILVAGTRRVFTSEAGRRPWLAGALAGAAVFAIAAGVDWMWELTVVPVAFLLLAAALLSRAPDDTAPARGSAPLRSPVRLGLVGLAVVGAVAVAIPLTADDAIESSQAAFDDRQLTTALEDVGRAAAVEPYAATPELQRALLLEADGDLDGAAAAATRATEADPVNWRTWLTLSRIEAQRGEVEASIAAYRRARDLNPRSPLFAGAQP